MDTTLTATVAVAGLIFSLTFALLLEELLFGVVFRLMACSRRIAAGTKKSPADQPRIAAENAQRAERLVI